MWAYGFYDLLIFYSIIVVSSMTFVYTRHCIWQAKADYAYFHNDISGILFYIKRLLFMSLYFRLLLIKAYMKLKNKARIHLVLVTHGVRTIFHIQLLKQGSVPERFKYEKVILILAISSNYIGNFSSKCCYRNVCT